MRLQEIKVKFWEQSVIREIEVTSKLALLKTKGDTGVCFDFCSFAYAYNIHFGVRKSVSFVNHKAVNCLFWHELDTV